MLRSIALGTVALELIAAIGTVTALIFLLDPIARRVGLLDRPGGRKDHAAPTPVTGGLAIALGTIIPALILTTPSPQLVSLGVGAVILILVGVLDDIYDLPWQFRVIAQVAAALSIVLIGGVKVEHLGPTVGLGEFALGYLSIPFSVLAIVGLINALNMADGIDGLAGSLCLCALVMLISASIYSGNTDLAHGLIILSGALIAFLAFNLRHPWRKRGRIFLGNSGSAYLGLIIAWAAFRLTQNELYPVTPVLAPFLIAPPVIDCLVLLVRRASHGHSPFHADRTHIHHFMLDAGFSVTGIVLTLCGFSLALGLGAALALLANVPEPWFVGFYILLVAGYFVISRRPDRVVGMFSALRRAWPIGRKV